MRTLERLVPSFLKPKLKQAELCPPSEKVLITNDHILRRHFQGREAVLSEISSNNGELADGYKQFLHDRIGQNSGFIGEIAIPQVLQNPNLLNRVIKTIALNMGLGHRRPQRCYEWLIHLMGFNKDTKHYFIGGNKRHMDRIIEEIEQAALELYAKYSCENAEKNGMYDGDPYPFKPTKYTKLLEGFINIYLTAQDKKVTPSELQKIFSGHIDANNPKDLEKATKDISHILSIFGEALIHEKVKNKAQILAQLARVLILKGKFNINLSKEDIQTSFLFLHPLPGVVYDNAMERADESTRSKYNAVGISTDRITDPAVSTGNTSRIRVACATDSGRQEAIKFWQLTDSPEEAQRKFPVVDGFTMPMAGFARNELTKKRKKYLEDGDKPITHILTASGIAIAQDKSFKDYINSLETQIKENKADVIIQCGYGKTGLMLKRSLESFLETKPEIKDKICLHWAESATAAVDFFEAISWTEDAVVLIVKASEMPNMAVDMGMPVVPLGCVGKVEDGNIVELGKYPKSTMILTRNVVEMARNGIVNRRIETFIKNKLNEYIDNYAPDKRRENLQDFVLTDYERFLRADRNIERTIREEVGLETAHLDKIALDEKDVARRINEIILNPPQNVFNPQAMMQVIGMACGIPDNELGLHTYNTLPHAE